eukprot:CAMPEP_0117683038 /NCGR_PEP_ID=MMETSP0804-20121206/20098_1 /TAXON_ID=1074897 /ORGANISM="Tetraselmis astigmatica, Strain CCMP880" /LENGTH=180 /DNA_ID=CAMNT_0005493427 /DNA_START=211 /DNA_END=754 /DNA_ORIENTATION=-
MNNTDIRACHWAARSHVDEVLVQLDFQIAARRLASSSDTLQRYLHFSKLLSQDTLDNSLNDTKELICMKTSEDCVLKAEQVSSDPSSLFRMNQKIASSRSPSKLPGPASIAAVAATACLSDREVLIRPRFRLRDPSISNWRLSLLGLFWLAMYAARSRNLLMYGSSKSSLSPFAPLGVVV